MQTNGNAGQRISVVVPSRDDFISYEKKKPWAFYMGFSTTVGKTSGVVRPQTTHKQILSHHSP